MRDAIGRLPVLLERTDTDVSGRGDIWMKYLGSKDAFRWGSRKLIAKAEAYFEIPSMIRCTLWAGDDAHKLENVLFVYLDANTLWWITTELGELLDDLAHSGGLQHDYVQLAVRFGWAGAIIISKN